MLMAGMGTEAFIFFMSTFEKAPKEYSWEKAYPQIIEDESDLEDGKTAVQKLNKIFKTACIASDHAGFKLKEDIKDYLIDNNFSVFDLGPYNVRSVVYPDYAKRLGNRFKLKKSNVGILVCGSGTGMAISANKIKTIRAAVCYNLKSTRLSRQHNNANIIALGSRLTKKKLSLKLVDIFLKTKFEGGRHLRRVKKI